MSNIISKIKILTLAILIAVPSISFASNFDANTMNATSVGIYGAKLNASISLEEGLGTVWFEYGANQNLDQITGTIAITNRYQGESQNVFYFLESLKPDTTYYYKVCLEASDQGETCGSTLSFKTKTLTVAPVASSTSNSTNSNTTSSTSSNSNSNSSTSTSSSTSTKKSTAKKEVTKEDNSQVASVAGATQDGNFLPDTFLEWIVVIALIFFIVMFGRYLYVKRQEEKEEEEKRRKEELIRAQVA